ncbi:alpha/beta hydrolase [Microbacterium jejuense]|uniref:alpha/beta hydrolase n=1 Tax=Microbacterium jejuense TaxID=1263637 RepID=UPI0031EFA649
MNATLGTVLVLPGGAYQWHAPHEAEPVAEWLESLGWDARVVRYPVKTQHPEPLDAVRREVQAARAAGARRVGVLGFSAGGHLAGHAALAPDSAPAQRPDFALLCYPVVSMVTRPHVSSRTTLLGEVDDDVAALVSLENLVRPDSPPVFTWHTDADPVVPAEHAYRLGSAFAAAGVPHEVHVFPGDVHGIGLAAGTAAAAWPELAAAWLARLPAD